MPGPDDELDDDAIRALLADLRTTEPTPDDVVARLDSALADEAPLEPEVSHPRWGRRLLVAAAAVVVVGGIATPIVKNGGGDVTSSSVASGGSAAAPDSARTQPPVPPESTQSKAADLPQLSTQGFATDVEQDFGSLSLGARTTEPSVSCPAATPSRILLFSRTVLLDGTPARLDVTGGPPGRVDATAYSCTDGSVLSQAKIDPPSGQMSPGPSPSE